MGSGTPLIKLGRSRSVSVAEAKASLSSILNLVSRQRKPVTILRRGVPIATLNPVSVSSQLPLAGSMAGTARELSDIVASTAEEWDLSEEWTKEL